MLLYPIILALVVKAPKYLSPLKSYLFIGVVFISQLIGMQSTYIKNNTDWNLVIDKVDNYLKYENSQKILMDGRSMGTFNFYNQNLEINKIISYTWEPIDSLESWIKDKERLVLLLNDWKSYTPLTLKQNWNAASSSLNRVEGLDSLLVLLNREYQLVDSYIHYPTFLYLLEKKERKRNEKTFGVWEYHLKDLILPVDISSREKIFSSLLIQPGDSVMIKSDSVLVLNLEKSQDISEGALIGTITANGREIHMIKGENIWDIFSEFYNENIDESKVFHSWYHTPLVSSAIRYTGSYFKHKARIYSVGHEQLKGNRIKITNTSKASSIRVWI